MFQDKKLSELEFDNQFSNNLPSDMNSSPMPRQVFESCFSWVDPTATSAPELVAASVDAAKLINLLESEIYTEDFTKIFSGNQLLPGMKPFACCYGGHQFGHWAGQLGDGRAINLGEVLNANKQHWTLQLKGSGLTPYSRSADGLAVLRSSIREFLCSEAMHFLGIPTTRALSLSLSGDFVIRDMFYDGHPQQEPGAIVCRLATSFIRFGNFQIFSARQELNVLKQLISFTINNDFPHLSNNDQLDLNNELIYQWFEEVCERTLTTVIHWMRVGFVHGVLNTDNMSILGLTIDYGPYGWLEDFNPDWTPNTTDANHHRYAYGKQIQIAQWNLMQLANALVPIVSDTKVFEDILEKNHHNFDLKWHQMLMQKLGIQNYIQNADDKLIGALMAWLCCREIDMTLFFRGIAEIDFSQIDINKPKHIDSIFEVIKPSLYQESELTQQQFKLLSDWIILYQKRLKEQGLSYEKVKLNMNRINPLYVLRNYLAQQAIDKAHDGDYSMIHELLEVLKNPYQHQNGKQHLQQKRPEWARHKPGCSMLSCSS